MKIVILNISDMEGGAARATYRLHRALLELDISSQMIVQRKSGDDYTVIGATTKLQKAVNLIRAVVDQFPVKQYSKRTKTPFSPNWIPFGCIVDKINQVRPDIVHLHWICGAMIKPEELAKIKFPIVWSLHDMWAFTGGCHYDEECGRYKVGCGQCRVLGSNSSDDLSQKIFRRKRKSFDRINNLTVVCLSGWLADCAKESLLFRDTHVVKLPNPIDTTIFKPLDKDKARQLWNLPIGKKLVLFGAVNATEDPRKGFKELSEALHSLRDNTIELVVFGSRESKETQTFPFKTYYLGQLRDDVNLVTLYSACDVMVVPSLQENLSNAIMESLSCGTPVVAFDIGGNGDMVEHKKNGYLVRPNDAKDLAGGIEWVLNFDNSEILSTSARNKVVDEFDSRIVAKQYISLYEEILRRHDMSR